MNRRVFSLGLAAVIGTTACGGAALMAEEPTADQPTADKKAPLPKTLGSIERLDPALDKLIAEGTQIEVLGGRYAWTEGPLWISKGGYLLFSEIPRNQIRKYKEGQGITVFLEKSGYTGSEPFKGPEPGTNGLTLDAEGRVVTCAHGDRVIRRLNADGTRTVLADKFEGKRLNSPNDLCYKSNGDLYFTDPPYGLPLREKDPAKELEHFGVYRLSKDGKLSLLTKEMTRPNGIAFSPDEKTLYVAQSDPDAAIIKTFPVKEDGTLGESKLFFDFTKWVKDRPGLPDGLKTDLQGNVWATAPGGVYVFSPDGKLLGRINTEQKTANCGWGDDGSTLYITADMFLCRVKTKVKGKLP